MSAPFAIINARLVDPARELDTTGGILVADRRIVAAGPEINASTLPGETTVIDAKGKLLAPGLIDMRVFTGEPGAEHKETLATASAAAAAGGVTTMVVMPNTSPVIDDAALVEFILRQARVTARVNVHPMAALTKGLDGKEMAELGLLKEAGAVGFTDGTRAVANARLLRRAMAYSTVFDALIVQHAEEPALAEGGAAHEGDVSMRLGLSGIPALAETILIERDLRLAALTGARYHIAQISSAQSLPLIRAAKAQGVKVTCSVSAAHLMLNELDIGTYRTFLKLSPPLRTEEDRMALVAGVADGTIDTVVSSHLPQDQDEKRQPFAQAAFGAIGLETLFAAMMSLVQEGQVPLMRALACLTNGPADILRLEAGRLAPGAPADFIIADPEAPWVVKLDALKSKSKNTPFEDRRLQGKVLATYVGGQLVFDV